MVKPLVLLVESPGESPVGSLVGSLGGPTVGDDVEFPLPE